jgi:hypothetical protein
MRRGRPSPQAARFYQHGAVSAIRPPETHWCSMKISQLKLPALAATMFVLQWTIASALVAAEFSAGDPFVVAQQGAPLMRGPTTLATLAAGQRLNVVQTKGDWIGTRAALNGRTIAGWVHQRQVATPSQYAQRRTTRRAYSYQPAPTPQSYPSTNRGPSTSPSNGGLIMGLTPYNRSYWRADRKVSGY